MLSNKNTLDIENQSSKCSTCLFAGVMATFICLLCIGPFAICDLYYSQKDNSCIGEYSKAANVNMQTYLLVSGIIEVVLIGFIGCLSGLTTLFEKNTVDILICSGLTPITIACLFLFAWNIVGAIIFWGHVYELGNCSHTTSTYIFASLIIKFVGCTSGTSAYSSKEK